MPDIEEKKIGFYNPPNNIELNVKTRMHKKKTALQKFCVCVFVLSIISSVITLMYAFLPVFNMIMIIFIGLVLCLAIMVIVLFTFGAVLASEGVRDWIGSCWGFAQWFSDVNENLNQLHTLFLCFVIGSLILNTISFVLSVICQKKEKKGYIAHIVVESTLTIMLIGFLISYYIFGKTIYGIE